MPHDLTHQAHHGEPDKAAVGCAPDVPDVRLREVLRLAFRGLESIDEIVATPALEFAPVPPERMKPDDLAAAIPLDEDWPIPEERDLLHGEPFRLEGRPAAIEKAVQDRVQRMIRRARLALRCAAVEDHREHPDHS